MKSIKQGLYQTQQQKLSPQQIQFVKLLQLPVTELEDRIRQELDDNMTLEMSESETEADNNEVMDNTDMFPVTTNPTDDSSESELSDEENIPENNEKEEISLEEIMSYDDTESYKTIQDDEDRDEIPIPQYQTLIEDLQQQVNLLPFTDTQKQIAELIIGSLEDDGYLKIPLETIQDDLDFKKNIKVSISEIEYVLEKIRYLDPVGIASRNLQECLTTQLKAKRSSKNAQDVDMCLKILTDLFDEFTKKHYDKIIKKLHITEDKLKELIKIITSLNPKPGDTSTAASIRTDYIIPDFTVTIVDDNKLQVTLNSKNTPELRINREYQEILRDYENNPKATQAMKDTIALIKSKIESAKWFIDAIKQRQNTLLLTMNCIADIQKDYFLTGDESKLKPMVLKDVADKIGMDISTVSRVANSKYVETDFGTFPLKHFFSEGIATETGEEVSNKEVKRALKELIDNEDKHNPISDDELSQMLQDRGYQIARRTVAKYREQLGIPVARLRKTI
ncbi:MAG: RNA polymerase factor sigma-54 [Bacteroidia bacterium]|nr:RNA polymerase factor sigma-54 [Bacteroidia bacterium]MDW8347733.1 RNA polymerase factor sigma-54 [Bacteroidia bacterium]